MQINIIGNIFGTSGYAAHTKQLAKGIYEMGGDVRLESPQPVGWEAVVDDAELVMLQKKKEDDRVDIAIDLPQNWQQHLSMQPKHFIGFCVWEGSNIPKFWIEHIMNPDVDAIFVPSTHVKKAILNTFKDSDLPDSSKIISKKIHVISHGVDPCIFYPDRTKRNKKCTFLANKGWTNVHNDRGGLQFVVQAFTEEFKKKDNVKLILKVNKAYDQNFNVKKAVLEITKGMDKKKLPETQITETQTGYRQLNTLYNEADIFVTASMAEGFNLPALEAMSCGLPVISTNYGGQTDFVNNKNGWLVKYKLFEQTNDVMYEGIKWAKPSIKDLRKKMREAFNLWTAKKLAPKIECAFDTATKFQWRTSGKKVIDIVDKLE